MYSHFRTDFLTELNDLNLPGDTLTSVLSALDSIASGYEITKKETSIVVSNYDIPIEVKKYIVTKSVGGFSKGTLKNYTKFLTIFFQSTRKPLKEITGDDITFFLYWYRDRGNKPIKDVSLNKVMDCLKAFFTWCYNSDYIDKDPTKAIMPIKCEKREVEPLSAEELEKVRRACITKRETAIVEILFSTGCRVSELCGMTKADVDYNNMTIHVLGKGKKHREVFMTVRSVFALKDYLEERTDDNDALFVSERSPHDPLKKAAVEKIIRNIASRSGIETHLTCHVFRHTVATLMLERGAAIQDIKTVLGHSQITTTMRYAKQSTSIAQDTHRKMVL